MHFQVWLVWSWSLALWGWAWGNCHYHFFPYNVSLKTITGRLRLLDSTLHQLVFPVLVLHLNIHAVHIKSRWFPNFYACSFLCMCLTSHSVCPHILQDRRCSGSHQTPLLHRWDWNWIWKEIFHRHYKRNVKTFGAYSLFILQRREDRKDKMCIKWQINIV